MCNSLSSSSRVMGGRTCMGARCMAGRVGAGGRGKGWGRRHGGRCRMLHTQARYRRGDYVSDDDLEFAFQQLEKRFLM